MCQKERKRERSLHSVILQKAPRNKPRNLSQSVAGNLEILPTLEQNDLPAHFWRISNHGGQWGGGGCAHFFITTSSKTAQSRTCCSAFTTYAAASGGSDVCRPVSLAFSSFPLKRISLTGFELTSLSPEEKPSVYIQLRAWGWHAETEVWWQGTLNPHS